MRIGLRVCVNTLQGALKGVPNLLRLFDEYQIQASFFFAMGPDNSGRSFGRGAMQPWFDGRSAVARVYDFVRMPSDISREAAATMRAVAEAGHETGVLGYDRTEWVKQAAHADADWTEQRVTRAVEAYMSVFQGPPRAYAAAGWQVNPHLFSLQQRLDFTYASDTRGKTLFCPVLQGVESGCPQIPTTLPSLPALLLSADVTPDNVHEYIYAESQYVLPNGHVYSLDAEMEGMDYLPLMEKLVVMWKGYGEGLGTLGEALKGLDEAEFRLHQVGWQEEAETGLHHAWQSLAVRSAAES